MPGIAHGRRRTVNLRRKNTTNRPPFANGRRTAKRLNGRSFSELMRMKNTELVHIYKTRTDAFETYIESLTGKQFMELFERMHGKENVRSN